MPSVASFMMPACKCVTACPEDKLRSVVDSLVNEKIGCVVVVDTLSRKAVGIITKQDVNRYFLSEFSEEFFQFVSSRATPPQIPLDTPVSEVMSTNLHPARPDMHRDDAAELLQREKIHHAIVVGEDGKFVGKIQNYRSDDAPPVSLPAWPYNRETGWTKFGAKSGNGK
ncbi:predicted protein [Micromonas commoda]|uniref:CBS domain-containing protein n=1 Tax=Micromonas commoda (strain RCC299 / NOUM17 / CCMP2709) TaxID=296587 RepID=C1E4K4_MICCC|nr:predicted protein [Micromonas commoda]ACO63135.1 predicted protein [Micromonas commoda]|eukprot:XP_002501877.1 predicted protein [Micromonas commoda]